MTQTKPKTSRNRQRKTAYAAMADKGSRHQQAHDGPVVGHFETVTHVTRTVYGEDGEFVRTYEAEVKPYERIVHDSPVPRQEKVAKAAGLANNLKKRRRQESAWSRCRVLRNEGKHDTAGTECGCCGCPSSIALAAVQP